MLEALLVQPTPVVSRSAEWNSADWMLLIIAVIVGMAIIVAILARGTATSGARKERL